MNSLDTVVTSPNYSYVFQFEEDFQHTDVRSWMSQHWTVCFYYVGAYMLLIFGGQQWMADRPRFELRGPLVFWNVFLAVFSIMGACRTVPEFFHVLRHHGIYHSVCVPSFIQHNKVSGFWTWMFVLSKVPELGDTIFIVLRKQPLIFLHWYHHATVLLYSWYAFAEYTAPARWFIVMNYVVHSMMYTYYALRALQFKIPKGIAMVITTAQLIQMVAGCAVNVWAYQLIERGDGCHVSQQNIKLSLLMYFSYFVLFARFFYKAYMDRNKSHDRAPSRTSRAVDADILRRKNA